jgi:8-oxo-dGTP pyrophosphatase MutT (NUDIX family)
MQTEGRTIFREAVRGIIANGPNLLMIFSTKNGDYKFPGGGIDDPETHQEALIREIREECGTLVTKVGPPFGKVIEYDVPIEPEYGVFKMTSFYYLCQVDYEFSEQKLDEYEFELGFQPVWVEINQAIQNNKKIIASNRHEKIPWLTRETFIMEQLQEHFFQNN